MVDSKENYKFYLRVKGLKEIKKKRKKEGKIKCFETDFQCGSSIPPILLNFLNNIHMKLQNANMLCKVKLLNRNFLLFFWWIIFPIERQMTLIHWNKTKSEVPLPELPWSFEPLLVGFRVLPTLGSQLL